jgi:cytochrome d ubiquinol oxidase subunit II
LSNRGVLPNPIQIVAFLMAVAAAWAVRDSYHGWAFAATMGAIGATVIAIFVSLYPNVMVSSTNSAYNLTVSNASSSSYSLTVMTVVAAIFTPLVLAYQGWSYYVFRARIKGPPAAPATAAPPPAAPAPPGPPNSVPAS